MYTYLQVHFEESQFELNRKDGKKLLRWNAVPTLFNVPNPPKKITDHRKRTSRTSLDNCIDENRELFDHNYYKKVKCTDPPVDSNLVQIEETSATANVDHSYSLPEPENCRNDIPFIGTRDSTVTRLRKKIRQLQQQLRRTKSEFSQLVSNMSGFLNYDQIQYLKMKSKRTIRWSNATIKSSLQLRYATGRKGYAHLRRHGYPIPAYRTLCERVEQAQFRPGIQVDVLDWLLVKIAAQPQAFKDCSLALDEMALRPCIEYDKG